jgi:hypothetical protein
MLGLFDSSGFLIKQWQRAEGKAQVVDHLPSKHKVLSLNLSTGKKKKRQFHVFNEQNISKEKYSDCLEFKLQFHYSLSVRF